MRFLLAIEDTEKQLCSMPMRQCDTLKYKQRKADLEGKLHELDEAIKERVNFLFIIA